MNSQRITYDRVSYSVQSNTPMLETPLGKQLLIHSVGVINNDSASMTAGVAKMFNTATAEIYENETTPVLASNPRNPTPNAGLVISCPEHFDLICFDSKTGTAALEYWNGSAWAALTPLQADTTFVRFNAPVQWVVGSEFTNLEQTLYYLKLTDLTAVADLKICKFFVSMNGVGSQQVLQEAFEDYPYLMESGEAVIPFFETADDNNVAMVAYRLNP